MCVVVVSRWLLHLQPFRLRSAGRGGERSSGVCLCGKDSSVPLTAASLVRLPCTCPWPGLWTEPSVMTRKAEEPSFGSLFQTRAHCSSKQSKFSHRRRGGGGRAACCVACLWMVTAGRRVGSAEACAAGGEGPAGTPRRLGSRGRRIVLPRAVGGVDIRPREGKPPSCES